MYEWTDGVTSSLLELLISAKNIRDIDHHMDTNHGGRWKLNDPDVLREGDVESSSESSYDSSLASSD